MGYQNKHQWVGNKCSVCGKLKSQALKESQNLDGDVLAAIVQALEEHIKETLGFASHKKDLFKLWRSACAIDRIIMYWMIINECLSSIRDIEFKEYLKNPEHKEYGSWDRTATAAPRDRRNHLERTLKPVAAKWGLQSSIMVSVVEECIVPKYNKIDLENIRDKMRIFDEKLLAKFR